MNSKIKKALDGMNMMDFDSIMKIQNNMNVFLEVRESVAKKLNTKEDALFNGQFKKVINEL
jgi:hypothetical protein